MNTLVYHSLPTASSEVCFLQNFHTTLLDGTELFVSVSLQDFFDERDGAVVFDLIKNTTFDHLLAGKSLPSYERFEEVLKFVNDELKLFMARRDDANIGELDAVIGFLSDDEFHVTKIGNASCHLIRKTEVVDISDGLYDPLKDHGEFFVNIASGALKKHDKIVFTTKPLLRFIPASELSLLFPTCDMKGSLDHLQAVIQMPEDQTMAISGFCVQKIEEPVVVAAQQPKVDRGTQVRTMLGKVRTALRKEDSRKTIIIGVVVLVVLLGVSLMSTLGQQKNAAFLEQHAKTLDEAKQEIHAARTEATSANKERAKQLLSDAETKLVALRDQGVFVDNVDELLETIAHEEAQMDNIEFMDSPREFANLTDILEGESIKNIINTDTGMYVYTDRSVVGPILEGNTASFKKESLPEGNTIISGDFFEDRDGLVFIVKPNKIAEFTGGAFDFIDTVDTVWKNGVDIRTYAERNFVYLLDPEENQIWRYRRLNTNYGSPSGWLTEKSDQELIDNDVVSFAIDGFIYVLKADGSMYKFYDGKKSEPFLYQDMPSEPLADLDDASKVFVRQNLKRVYVLDHKNARVLVFRKDPVLDVRLLRYERQFQFPDRDIRGITVNDDEITMYVADRTTIYKVEL